MQAADTIVVVLQVPISCLQWEHRLPLILQEIWEADADIICLQELNHFGESPGGQTQQQASDASSRHGHRCTNTLFGRRAQPSDQPIWPRALSAAAGA
jgi:endonuclease/exonuclease/phosphatase family metal-dependent hydrolase